MSMTPRERVFCALRHESPDRVPHHISTTAPMHTILTEHFGAVDLDIALDNHLVKYKPRGPEYITEIEPNIWRDEFGVIWDRTYDSDVGVIRGSVLEEPSLDGYRFPDPQQASRYERLPAFIETYPDRYRVINLSKSLFERAWSLRGFEQFLMDIALNPEWVGELLDMITEFNLAVIEQVVQYDIDAVMFGDDWAGQNGLLISPKSWRTLLKPRLERQYSAVKRANKSVFIHCCGNCTPLIPDLIELGVDVLNPLQPEALDPGAIKARYGDQLTLYGGISIQQVLPFGTPAEVREIVQRMAATLGADGGYILAPAHDLPPDVPLANVLALLEGLETR